MDFENSPAASQPAAPVESVDVNTEIAQEPVSQTDESNEGEAKPQAEAKPDPIQKRFNELTYQRHEADRRANEAVYQYQQQALQIQEMQRRLQHYEILRERPNPSSFATPEEFAQANDEFLMRRAQSEQQEYERNYAQQQQAIQAQQQHAQHVAAVNAASQMLVAEGNAKYPDFEAVVNDPKLPPVSGLHPVVLNAFFSNEKRVETAYYFGKNPMELHKFLSLPPVQQIAELGRIESRLTRSSAINQSPNPLSSVPGQAAQRSGSLTGLSTEEFIKRRNEADRKSGRG